MILNNKPQPQLRATFKKKSEKRNGENVILEGFVSFSTEKRRVKEKENGLRITLHSIVRIEGNKRKK